VDRQKVGALLRAVRRRRGLRQVDVAEAAGLSDSAVSLVERGHLDTLSIRKLERLAGVLDIWLEISARWRGGDGDRMLNRTHSALADGFAGWLAAQQGWFVEPEVSFSVYGERGVIDQLAWHEAFRHLLVIELKTELVDVNEMLGTLDRKVRLARIIARERGLRPEAVSCWLVIRDTHTNRRHATQHAALLRARFPSDGRHLRGFVARPRAATFGLAFWPDSTPRGTSRGRAAGKSRVRHRGVGQVPDSGVGTDPGGPNGRSRARREGPRRRDLG
jgi:transcriptional regulator with XRE-family HTH domain